jgi:hypothetical protein
MVLSDDSCLGSERRWWGTLADNYGRFGSLIGPK